MVEPPARHSGTGSDGRGPASVLDVPALVAGRYRLGEVVGRGGVGTVHRAEDTLLGRSVAVKLLPVVAEGDDELLRHQAELRALAGLDHPGLVTLYDGGSEGAEGGLRGYLVMELVTGPTLRRRLAEGGPLTAPQVARLGRYLADALAAVHACGILHRDVKPGNILLVADDALDDADDDDPGTSPVRLADFGIARISDATRLTLTGKIVGTASYLSPEQALGGALGPGTDVYALGLVLLECLTGVAAYRGTVAEVAAARLARDPEVPDGLDAGLVDLVVRMTARAPDDRPTAREVADALAAWVAAGPGSRSAVTARFRPDPPTRVLPVVAADAAVDTDAGEGARPAAPVGRKVRWLARTSRATRVTMAAVAVALLAAGTAVGVDLASAAPPADPPAYPAVDGTLGTALTRLQESVAP